jgi:hypothetical protein
VLSLLHRWLSQRKTTYPYCFSFEAAMFIGVNISAVTAVAGFLEAGGRI